MTGSPSLTRRQLLVAGGVGAGVVTTGGLLAASGRSGPASPADVTIRARRSELALADREVTTWTYDGALPGRELRLRQGRPVRVRLVNELDEPTSIHWHGVRVRNAADGVPGMTQEPVQPGDSFVYAFTPPDAGTYFLHSHVGTQLDRGLYAPLVVEAAEETLRYDREATLLFDDWLDGIDGSPDDRLHRLRAEGMNMGGMDMSGGSAVRANARYLALDGTAGGRTSLAGMARALDRGKLDAGDVRDYPLYLVNGRPPADPARVTVRRGQRLRLRLVNPSADTIYLVFVEGHDLEVVHADGQPVRPVRAEALVLGMGERYDAILRATGRGYARIFALPLGKRGSAMALLRYADATGPAPAVGSPPAAPRRVLSYADLQPLETERAAGDARTIRLDLAMGDGMYSWTIGGQTFETADRIDVDRGERIRFVMRNTSRMPHPMHLHGHSFRLGGPAGPLKDTALALPDRELALEWVADNPGSWAYHCHNAYHQAAGMMRQVKIPGAAS